MAARVQIRSLAPGIVQDTTGAAQFNASVRVFAANTTTPVTVYQGLSGGATIPQPLPTDHEGEVPGYLLPGQIVDISVNGGPVTQVQVPAATLPWVSSGTAVLVAGTVAVADTSITAISRIRYWVDTPGGTRGFLSFTRTPGTGFTFNSASGADTSTLYYEVASY